MFLFLQSAITPVLFFERFPCPDILGFFFFFSLTQPGRKSASIICVILLHQERSRQRCANLLHGFRRRSGPKAAGEDVAVEVKAALQRRKRKQQNLSWFPQLPSGSLGAQHVNTDLLLTLLLSAFFCLFFLTGDKRPGETFP